MTSLAEAINQASLSFTGRLMQPADAGYDERRRVHNGLIDKRPALDRALPWHRPTSPTP